MVNLRESTKNRRPGDVRRMLEERDPDFVEKPTSGSKKAVLPKEASRNKKEKERLLKEKEDLKAAGIEKVGAIENAIAREDEQAQSALPRRKKGMS